MLETDMPYTLLSSPSLALVAGLVSGGMLFYVSTVLTALNISQIKSLLKFDKGVI